MTHARMHSLLTHPPPTYLPTYLPTCLHIYLFIYTSIHIWQSPGYILSKGRDVAKCDPAQFPYRVKLC